MRITIFPLKFLIFLSITIFGCEKNLDPNTGSNENFSIGFSQCNTDDIWRQAMNREMRIEASLYPNIELIIRDGERDSQNQINDIKQFIKENVDLIIVSPNEAQPITPITEQAYSNGIPIVLIDRKIDSDAYTAYVGADNYEIGKTAGRYIRNILRDKGTVFEIWGLRGSSPAIERHNGFYYEVSQAKNIKVINGGDGQWEEKEGYRIMSEFLLNNEVPDLVYTHNDFMAFGVNRVLTEKSLANQVKLVGIDALPGSGGGIQKVIDGKMTATLLYPTGGDVAIQTAINILNKQPYEREKLLSTVLINADNARIVKLQADQIINHQKKIEAQITLLSQQVLKYETQRERFYISVIVIAIILFIVFFILRAYHLISRINRELEEKNQAIIKQKEEIEEQRDTVFKISRQLEEINQKKLQFFTNISHEFRTPLTLILGPLEEMVKDFEFDQKTRQKFGLMFRNADRLLRLVNQLMDLRKLDVGKMQLLVHCHNIVSFVNDISLAFEGLSKKKNIKLQFESEKDEIKVWFDEEKIDKIIFNLLSNAFKFTPAGGQVSIKISTVLIAKIPEKEFVCISIQDTGTGIPKEKQDRIFERFYQVHEDGKMIHAGTGIGLSLSKSFVDMHHGSIELESQPGEGSTISVHLPLGNEHFKEEEIAQISEKTEQFHPKHDNLELETIYESETQQEMKDSDRIQKPSILIIDDNSDVITFVAGCLGGLYRIQSADNGKNGLDLARKHLPDLIISDVMMPEMDGIELTKILKTDIKTSHIPIILLTARTSEAHQINGFETGADYYITKPFTSELLRLRVRNVIEMRKKLHELYMKNFGFSLDQTIVSTVDKKFLTKVVLKIEENLVNPDMNVDALGRELGLSRVHLYRKIKALTGQSAVEFIRSIRLKKSIELLRHTDKDIAEIAYEVGFETPSYFTKCFRKQFKKTPSEYLELTTV